MHGEKINSDLLWIDCILRNASVSSQRFESAYLPIASAKFSILSIVNFPSNSGRYTFTLLSDREHVIEIRQIMTGHRGRMMIQIGMWCLCSSVLPVLISAAAAGKKIDHRHEECVSDNHLVSPNIPSGEGHKIVTRWDNSSSFGWHLITRWPSVPDGMHERDHRHRSRRQRHRLLM
jgi:hypothetical protein